MRCKARKDKLAKVDWWEGAFVLMVVSVNVGYDISKNDIGARERVEFAGNLLSEMTKSRSVMSVRSRL